jgi:hypothetical protein
MRWRVTRTALSARTSSTSSMSSVLLGARDEPLLEHGPREPDMAADLQTRERPSTHRFVHPARLDSQQRCRLVWREERLDKREIGPGWNGGRGHDAAERATTKEELTLEVAP